MEEIWKPIAGIKKGGFRCKRSYEVSNKGRVIGRQGRIMKFGYRAGYASIDIFDKTLEGKRKVNHYLVHRLVAQTFILNPLNLSTVDHIDRNKLNNNIGNLRWASKSQNSSNIISKVHTSKYHGVFWHKSEKKWRAVISVKQEKINLGAFKSETEAASAYNKASIKYRGKDFAYQNEI